MTESTIINEKTETAIENIDILAGTELFLSLKKFLI